MKLCATLLLGVAYVSALSEEMMVTDDSESNANSTKPVSFVSVGANVFGDSDLTALPGDGKCLDDKKRTFHHGKVTTATQLECDGLCTSGCFAYAYSNAEAEDNCILYGHVKTGKACEAGFTMRNHQYDNSDGTPNCECVEDGDPCETDLGANGAHCIIDPQCHEGLITEDGNGAENDASKTDGSSGWKCYVHPTPEPCPFLPLVEKNTDLNKPYWHDVDGTVATPEAWDNAGFFESKMWNKVAHVHPKSVKGAKYGVGTHFVVFEGEDQFDNRRRCRTKVVVTDNERPRWLDNCPQCIVQNTDPGKCGAKVKWVPARAVDNYAYIPGQAEIPKDAPQLISTVPSYAPGDFFPKGKTMLKYVFDDQINEKIECEFSVTVVDSEDPEFTCTTDVLVKLDASDAEVSTCSPTQEAQWTCQVSDNCGAQFECKLPTKSQFAVGSHTSHCRAWDAASNEVKREVQIVTEDVTPPILMHDVTNDDGVESTVDGCPPDIDIDIPANSHEVEVDWPQVYGKDNSCGETPTEEANSYAPGHKFIAGEYEVLYTATDPVGLTDTCSFKIQTNDVTAPVWANCPTDGFEVETFANTHVKTVDWTAPTATDNSQAAGGTITFGGDWGSIRPGMAFPAGVTEVVYTATDDSGNEAICQFDIKVNDVESPEFENVEKPANKGLFVMPYEQCGGTYIPVDAHDETSQYNTVQTPIAWDGPTECSDSGYECKVMSAEYHMCTPKEIPANAAHTSQKWRVRNRDDDSEKYKVVRLQLFSDCACNDEITSVTGYWSIAADGTENAESGLPIMNTLWSGNTDCKVAMWGDIASYNADTSDAAEKANKADCAQVGMTLQDAKEVRCITYQDTGRQGSGVANNPGSGSKHFVVEAEVGGSWTQIKEITKQAYSTAAESLILEPLCLSA